jgi:hypothetical protein
VKGYCKQKRKVLEPHCNLSEKLKSTILSEVGIIAGPICVVELVRLLSLLA